MVSKWKSVSIIYGYIVSNYQKCFLVSLNSLNQLNILSVKLLYNCALVCILNLQLIKLVRNWWINNT